MDYRLSIDMVTTYIHNHINEELKLDKLAGLAGLSRFHFHRVFATLVGRTVARYVREQRLTTAAEKLLQSHESVTEIALAVGYQSPASFTKAFRKEFGITPMILRTINRSDANEFLPNRSWQ